MYGHNSEKSHMIRVPFGIEILCCIIMVNIVGAGLPWETKLDRDCNSTEMACESFTGEILRPTDGAAAKTNQYRVNIHRGTYHQSRMCKNSLGCH